MSESKEFQTPSLSQYFGSDTGTGEADFTSELNETANKLDNITMDDSTVEPIKKDPVICKLFSENSRQPKETAPFFDYFGYGRYVNKNQLDSEIESDTLWNDVYEPMLAVGSAAERRRDAWIPSEQTRQILIKVATSPPGTFFPEREYLTMPGVILEEELGDSIGEAVSVCLGEAEAAERRIITANDVTQDERGLRELMQAGAHRAAINLTGRLLEIHGQGKGRGGHPSKHSRHSLQLWFTRLALLIKTRAFTIAEAEAETFGNLDQPDVFYQFYPEMYGDRPGSIAPFSFRLLLAELPMHCGKYAESLPKLFDLYHITQQIHKNLQAGLCEDGNPLEISEEDRSRSERLWSVRSTRVYDSIINCAIHIPDHQLAIELMHQSDMPLRFVNFSMLARLHLAMGDTAGAEHNLNLAHSHIEKDSEGMQNKKQLVTYLVDKALICIGISSYEEAVYLLQQASALDPTNAMILNNMSICHTNMGRVKEAIASLETAIAVNPAQALSESLITNLCTLYDMESSQGRMKKFAILKKLSRYHMDAPKTVLEKLCG